MRLYEKQVCTLNGQVKDGKERKIWVTACTGCPILTFTLKYLETMAVSVKMF